LPEPPARTTVRLSDMPYLLPLLQLRPPAVAHVVVVVDDRGADLYTDDGDGHRTDRRTEGAHHPEHKVHGGGWSHRSMQSRARRRCAGPSMPPPTKRCRRPRSRPAPAP
ncbi:baeRF2 domain-containing protein, partial [Nocardia nova]|uniref:baeRF2 domain-containing protein n=1 Tax=Nocardia nova TaxID=37330 RepID=UPI003F6C253A